MQELRGRVAVVTGAASGIGLGIATEMVGRGMAVVMADTDEERLAREAATLGADVAAVPCDVGDPDQVAALAAATLDRFGTVHVVCNNAGIMRPGRCWELPLGDWEAVLRVNLMGVVHGVRTFVPILLAAGVHGHVVNVASMAAVVPVAGIGPYNVAKHGVLGLSDTLRMELQAAGAPIGVSVVMPGRVPTRLGRRPVDPDPPAADPSEPGLLPASEVGRIVVDAVVADRPYVFTHPDRVPQVRARFTAIAGP